MKVTVIIITTFLMQVSAATFGQSVTIHNNRITLIKAFEEIRKQTGYTVLYKHNLVNKVKPIGLNMTNVQLEQALEQILKGKELDFSIQDKAVIIKEKEQSFFEKVVARFQRIDIKGLVVDSTGAPIPGATVKVKGFKQSTTTDGTGRFGLANVEDNATIVISFLGFKTIEMPANGNFSRIVLNVVTSDLEEVAIVNKGYYQTKKDLETGNVATVTAKEIGQSPVNNVLQAMQGRVPGLIITQKTGAPGGGFSVQLRGRNSIANGSDPLYIVDGVPYASETIGSLSITLQGSNPLNFINPEDIEQVDVLKDADATAIYGSRAANGVILITTKKGKAGQSRINVDASSGIGQRSGAMKLLNTQQYLEMRNEAFKNDGIEPAETDYDVNGVWGNGRYTDWQRELIGNTAQYNDVQLSMSGGSSTTQYVIGGAYHKETTVMPGDWGDRKVSSHFNITHRPENSRFKALFSGSYTLSKNDLPLADLTNYITLSPTAPALYNADGSLNWAPLTPGGAGTWENPLNYSKLLYTGKNANLVANSVLSYSVLKDLEFSSSFGYTSTKTDEHSLYPLAAYDPGNAPATGSSQFLDGMRENWIIEPQLTYGLQVGNNRFSALVGSTFQQNLTNLEVLNASGYTSDVLLDNPKAASVVSISSFSDTRYKYNAIYGRINYNYLDKYLLNLTARRDATSRFGPENRVADFYSVGAAWIISNENWFKTALPFVSFAKIRGSYGTSGNDQIADYRFLDLYTTTRFPYQGKPGLFPNRLYNPVLAWELNKKAEAGVELRFLNDRVMANVSYFSNRSGNQLVEYPLSIITGFRSISRNLPAVVGNSGTEIVIGAKVLDDKVFNWSTSLNVSANRNKLVSFPDLAKSSYSQYYEIGKSLNAVKLYQWAGMDSQTGKYQFMGKDGNLTTDPVFLQDNIVNLDLTPKYYGGFQNNVSYKNFNLDFLFQFVKQKGVSSKWVVMPGYVGFNQPEGVMKRWQSSGDVAEIQKFTTLDFSYYSSYQYAVQSDIGYEDASFIRLKNVNLSYQLPLGLLKSAHIASSKIYLQGQNLLTFTRYKGLDPETQSMSVMPTIQIMIIGAQITF